MKKILDNSFNLGFAHGYNGYRCILTLSLLKSISDSLCPDYDLCAEYIDGWNQAKASGRELLTEKTGCMNL